MEDFGKAKIDYLRQFLPYKNGIPSDDPYRSFDGETGMLHMVSAYATETRLVLAQEKVSEKRNEIKAIPKLLAMTTEGH